jgi:hypothetical protein
MDWIWLAEDREKCHALFNMVIRFLGSTKFLDYLRIC